MGEGVTPLPYILKLDDKNQQINVSKLTPTQAKLATLPVLPNQASLGQKGKI